MIAAAIRALESSTVEREFKAIREEVLACVPPEIHEQIDEIEKQIRSENPEIPLPQRMRDNMFVVPLPNEVTADSGIPALAEIHQVMELARASRPVRDHVHAAFHSCGATSSCREGRETMLYLFAQAFLIGFRCRSAQFESDELKRIFYLPDPASENPAVG